MPFWDESCASARPRHPEVEVGAGAHRRAAARRSCSTRRRFDVIVGSNLFGDILSDLAAAVAG